MKKIYWILISIVLCIGMSIISCNLEYEPFQFKDSSIEDEGMLQIGDNVYIKRLHINGRNGWDNFRLFFLVDSTGKLINESVNLEHTLESRIYGII